MDKSELCLLVVFCISLLTMLYDFQISISQSYDIFW